jgi:hypothetical protein
MLGGLAFVTAVGMLLCIRSLKPAVIVLWMMYAATAAGYSYAIGV